MWARSFGTVFVALAATVLSPVAGASVSLFSAVPQPATGGSVTTSSVSGGLLLTSGSEEGPCSVSGKGPGVMCCG